MKFIIELFVAKVIVFLINIIAPDKGTSFPGKLMNRLDRNFARSFKGIDYDKVVFITGTNGKSTLTNLIHHILKKNGYDVVANLQGANQLCGITTTLIKNSDLRGNVKGTWFVFEVDERSFYQIYPAIPGRHVVVTNIQKDQVQRNGDPDFIIRKLKEVINGRMTLYLNNDEPRSKSFEALSEDVIYYGVDKNASSYEKTGLFDISMPCPVCGRRIEFDYLNIDNVGPFSCSYCQFATEKDPNVLLKNIDFALGRFSVDGQGFEMPYTIPFMLYNYAAAIAVCANLGLKMAEIARAFTSFINIGGRIETLRYRGKEIKYIRIKQENPETLQSALDSVASDKTEKVIVLGLYELVDFDPHYTNTFYAYECDISKLAASGVKKYVCFSEYVCYDTALRFLYDGVDEEDIIIVPSKEPKDVLAAIEKADCENVYLITWLLMFNNLKNYIKGGEADV